MNHINNITNLENEMVNLLLLALKQPFLESNYINHPIRIIEASKSLIGLNLKDPNKNIIDFLNSLKFEEIQSSEEKPKAIKNETISIYQLEDAINNSDTDRINELLDNILNLSDGKHVLEFLVELSLRQKGQSLQVIWPIYKAMNFIGYNDINAIRNSLDMACKLLIFDDFHDASKEEKISMEQLEVHRVKTVEQLYMIGVVHEISNFKFVRYDFIKQNLSLFLNHFHVSLNQSNPKPCKIKSNGLKEDSDLLEVLDSFTLSKEMILIFNSVRSIMKYSKSVNNRSIIYHIENIKRLINE